jgi:hypothetical protein
MCICITFGLDRRHLEHQWIGPSPPLDWTFATFTTIGWDLHHLWFGPSSPLDWTATTDWKFKKKKKMIEETSTQCVLSVASHG